MRKGLFASLAAAAIGGGLGWLSGGRDASPVAASAEVAPAHDTLPAASTQTVAAEVRTGRQSAWEPGERAMLFDWARRKWLWLTVPVFGGMEFEINPEFAALFDLSEEETAAIEDALVDTYRKFQQLELASASTGYSPDGTES